MASSSAAAAAKGEAVEYRPDYFRPHNCLSSPPSTIEKLASTAVKMMPTAEKRAGEGEGEDEAVV